MLTAVARLGLALIAAVSARPAGYSCANLGLSARGGHFGGSATLPEPTRGRRDADAGGRLDRTGHQHHFLPASDGRAQGELEPQGRLSSVAIAANAGYYADLVREKAILRRLVEASSVTVSPNHMCASSW